MSCTRVTSYVSSVDITVDKNVLSVSLNKLNIIYRLLDRSCPGWKNRQRFVPMPTTGVCTLNTLTLTIPHGGLIELFLVRASAPRLV